MYSDLDASLTSGQDHKTKSKKTPKQNKKKKHNKNSSNFMEMAVLMIFGLGDWT